MNATPGVPIGNTGGQQNPGGGQGGPPGGGYP
jgi:hypothetical protein